MHFQLHQLVVFVKTLLKAKKGRPVALAALLGLVLLNLISEWPHNLPQTPFLKSLGDIIPTPFKGTRQTLFDQYQRRFPRTPLSQPVTIVAIDESSLAHIGQWPWPRNRLAALIDAINRLRPLAIGLDIYMPEADQTSPGPVADNLPPSAGTLAAALRALPSHEATLARSLQAAPTILGAAAFDHPAFTTSTSLRTAPILVTHGNPLQFVRRFDNVLASLPELQQAAHGEALLSVELEQGVVRRIPLVLGLGDKLVPGLPMEMLRVATGTPGVEVSAGPAGIESVAVGDAVVPTQPNGDIWLHFAKIQSTQDRYVSALDVLQGKADPARFENKLVLIGLTGAGLNDMRTTALGELVPGIEIQAQVIESIFDGRLLLRPVWLKWAETAFVLVFGAWMIWYVPRVDSRLAVFIRAVPKASAVLGFSLNLVMLSGGFLLFARYGLLVDAASIFIILSAIMGSLVSSAVVEIEQKKMQEIAQSHQDRESAAYRAGEAAALAALSAKTP